MRTLTVTLLLALSGCSLFHGERLGKPLKNRNPEQPVAQWIQAVRTSDSKGFYKVWSDKIHRNIEAFKSGSRKEFCKQFLALHAELWVDEFPHAQDGDLTFSYAGNDAMGEVTISYKGKEVDPKLISPLTVVLENGFWKIAIVPGP